MPTNVTLTELDSLLNSKKDVHPVAWWVEELGMSKRGVLMAIERGDLPAFRLKVPWQPHPTYFVTRAAIKRFKTSPRNLGGRPRGS